MKTIKGPALFLAQFAGDDVPFNSWNAITAWAADCGYKGVQVPSWVARLSDLATAAESKDYCGTFKGQAAENGVEVTELSTHLQVLSDKCEPVSVCRGNREPIRNKVDATR
ncbi:hypothetical protein RUM4293_01620 [Ruegeria atlantica]|uniref:Uncharacterized protein n=1 Tax=Ruegeria atlantica TaxID=81569 RepID=A0A0P1E367_9RHOB|nr:hypothetical protein RUM4293_01620 [Ruegeria atlantica]